MNEKLCLVAVLAPSVLFAQNAFEGTWKTMLEQSNFSEKPASMVRLARGRRMAGDSIPQKRD
jgi:hypothetical protein